MRRIALRLAYDGTHFVGSQWQTNGRSVQGVLEEAWQRFSQEHQRIIFAGRTDAGVHAQGQVAHVATETHHDTATVQRALNALLPADVAVLAAWDVDETFHARYSARWRAYRYLVDASDPVPLPLLRHTVLHVGHRLNTAAMQAALALLVGEHDFAAFASTHEQQGSTVRQCYHAACEQVVCYGRPLLAIDLQASGFLRHMVRALVGTLLLVGQQRMTVETFGQVLASRDRRQAGPTAAAHGLILIDVGYASQSENQQSMESMLCEDEA